MDSLFDISAVLLGYRDVPALYEVTRMEVSYNEDNMPDVILYFSENADKGWSPFRKRVNIYDGNKKLIKDTSYNYEDTGNWIHSSEYTYTYDENGNPASIIGNMGDERFNHETYFVNVYISGNNANDAITGISSGINISFAGGQLHVEPEDDVLFDVAVYSMQGMLAAQRNGNYGEATISLDKAPHGIYIVRIVSGKHVYTRKFLKK
jgi:hypothetical protein